MFSAVRSPLKVLKLSAFIFVYSMPKPGPNVPRKGMRSACQSTSKPKEYRFLVPNMSLYG